MGLYAAGNQIQVERSARQEVVEQQGVQWHCEEACFEMFNRRCSLQGVVPVVLCVALSSCMFSLTINGNT